MCKKIIELKREKGDYGCILCGNTNDIYTIRINKRNKKECIICSNICEQCRMEIIKEMNCVNN